MNFSSRINLLKCKRLLSRNKYTTILVNSTNSNKTLVTKSKESSYSRVVNEAEKVVGYPTSFLSLRWLLNDEIANIASHIKRLIGTEHPLLTTARDLIINRQTPTWGLIVLLVSKAAGLKDNVEYSVIDRDITAGILHSQRVLAEITDMIRTSNLIHKSILNMNTSNQDPDLCYGNKVSLLTGDYLLSNSFRELATIGNHEVNELVSTCLRDLAEAGFIEPHDSQNKPFPARPKSSRDVIEVPNIFGTEPFRIEEVLGNARAEWILRHLLGNASLLAKCCQGAIKLAEHTEEYQENGYLFGRNMALAWQANKDIESFKNHNSEALNYISAPLMFHLEHDPSFYDILVKQIERDSVDYGFIRERVTTSGYGLQKANELKTELIGNCFKALEGFADSDAKSALVNIVKVL